MSLAHLARRFFRQPATAVPAIVLVALASGVSTGQFVYLGALLWPWIDAPRPERLVSIYVGTAEQPRALASFREYELLRGHEGLASLAAFTPLGVSLDDGDSTRFAWTLAVSADYFELFGARPQIGRLLQPADDRPGAPPVAVLHPSFWRAPLGADPAIVGRPLRLNGTPVTVVGIAPDGFQGHGLASALYFPLAHADALAGVPRIVDPESRWLPLLGRMEAGWSIERLRGALAAVGRAADAERPRESGPRRIAVVRADRHDDERGPDPQLDSARALFAGALLFLVLAGASLTNLLLARTTARRREWEIRAALGQTRARMALAVIAESGLISLVGGMLGLPIALLVSKRLETLALTEAGGLGNPAEWSRLVQLDVSTYAFALATSAACGLLAGVASLPSVLRDRRGGTLAARGAAGEAMGLGGRRALVALQVALSLVLCLGGGLLARSLQRASRHNPGYAVERLHIATIYTPRSLDGGTPQRLQTRLLEEVAEAGWARTPSLSHQAPLAGWYRPAEVAPVERSDQLQEASYDLVSPGYFDTLGLKILAGRPIDERDHADAVPAVVIAEALARRLWGSAAAAVGHGLVSAGSPHDSWQVVGVVADVRAGMPDSPAPAAVYFPLAQRTHPRANLLLRSTLPAAEVDARLRDIVHHVHPGLAVVELTTGEEARRRLVTPQRMHAEIASLFALLGSAVAMVGLFGLLSQAVVAGGRDLAVRLAVGATGRDLLRLVAGNALRILGAGGLLGLALWIPLARLLRGMLFGVEPLDPPTLAAAPALLALAAALAAAWPVLRATRTDPAIVLREQ